MTKWISEVCAKDLWLKLAAIMTIIGFVILGYWRWFDPGMKITVFDSHIVQAGPFKADDWFQIERNYCTELTSGTGYRYLVGDVGGRTDVYNLQSSDLYLSKECPGPLRRWIHIPAQAAPGKYEEKFIIVYPKNPLENGRVEFPGIAFDVVKADH